MAKEEKPLEYQHRIRDTKGVAQRLDLDYLKRPGLIKILRARITWLLLAASLLAAVPLVFGIGASRKILSNGPLSKAHGAFEGRCEVCHAKAFTSIPDAACERCHDGAAHPAKMIDTAKANVTPPCVDCHIEHRGKTQLADVANGNCTRCHDGLAAHATGVKIKATSITAFRENRHPEFSSAVLKDTRPMQLNHAKHMPLEPKTIRGMKLPMKCEDCHVTDLNSNTGALIPVTFEKNCKTCHSRELQFDVYQVLGENAPPSPHTRDAQAIREIISAAYRDALERNPSLASQPLGRDMAPPANSALWLERVTKDSLDFVFERKCTYCHQLASYATVTKIDPIQGRFPEAKPWVPRSEFSHRAHRPVACESCHSAARASTKTEDVLIPTLKTCLPCHGESRAGLDRCSECHRYHNRNLEKERERRPTEELISGNHIGVPSISAPAALLALPEVRFRPATRGVKQ